MVHLYDRHLLVYHIIWYRSMVSVCSMVYHMYGKWCGYMGSSMNMYALW